MARKPAPKLKTLPQSGEVVTVDFPGITGIKGRPALIVSTNFYHSVRSDVIIGILTSQIQDASTETDYVLKNWKGVGLHQPTALRTLLVTVPLASVTVIGQLTHRDWQEVLIRLKRSLSLV